MTNEEIVARLIEEGPFPAKAATKLVGQLQGGRPVAPSTISRWMQSGHRLPDGRRVRLEALRIGGRLCTTRQAILRFLVAQQPVEAVDATPVRSPAARRRAADRAMSDLADAGGI